MQTEQVPVAELHLDPANARLHSQRNLEAIKGSLQRFGQQKPIVVDADNVVRAGNGTLQAAKALGWEEISVVRSELIGPEMTAFTIADNRTAELAEWDEETLARTLEALSEDIPTNDTGFSSDEMQGMLDSLRGPIEVEEDEVPEPPEEPITQPGDLWTLGEHRVLCGDATSPDDVECLLDGAEPRLMVTDPPYGVEYDPEWRVLAEGIANTGEFAGLGKVENDTRADWREAWALFPGKVAYVWHAGVHASIVAESLQGFDIRAQIIWAKTKAPISRGAYHWKHEPCWYAVRQKATAAWIGDRSQTTLWEIPTNAANDSGHGTQKPAECMARPIRNHSGDVYDPFLGSGTTLIAAEQLGRACYGMEISPAYCDVIVQRWENLTGQTAERIEGGVCDRTTDSLKGGKGAN